MRTILLIPLILLTAGCGPRGVIKQPPTQHNMAKRLIMPEPAPQPRELFTRLIYKDGKGEYKRLDTNKNIVWMTIGKEDILPEWDVDPKLFPPGAPMPNLERAWLDCKPGIYKMIYIGEKKP